MYKILIIENAQKNTFYTEGGEVFATEDVEVVKSKYISLLDTYPKSKLDIVKDVTETITVVVD